MLISKKELRESVETARRLGVGGVIAKFVIVEDVPISKLYTPKSPFRLRQPTARPLKVPLQEPGYEKIHYRIKQESHKALSRTITGLPTRRLTQPPISVSTSCVNTCPAEVNCNSTQTCEHGECVTIATGSYCMDITAIEIVDYTIIGTNNDTTELRCSLDKANYTYTSTAHLNNDRYDCKVGSNRYTASGILSCTYKEAQAHTACDIIYQQCSSIGGNIWGNTRCRWNVNQGSCCYVLKVRITGY
ncbi:hypothetical protein K457DRAFT_19481 [Linnemannia elongata AG-77]|uniref:Uncharacterized protein n=1 Tax=Linnemannia elongata AG-77 TaxID=1314771 RepID=A0A197JUV0_9FUNG|nr:hypothetical protein K457DRAFT_19481 [Linnemannia elongata AG-77]